MENQNANTDLQATNGENGNGHHLPELITKKELDELAREVGSKETAVKIISYAEKYSGFLPHPRLMAQYKAILPDAPDRIITMAENQQQHRMGLEQAVIQGDVYRANLGLILGFTLFSFFCYWSNHIAGAWEGFTGI